MRAAAAVVLGALVAGACGDGSDAPETPEAGRRIELTSPAFEDGAEIPVEHTCDGAGAPIPLRWERVAGADGYVVTMTDPDAPSGPFVHWLVTGIPAAATGLGDPLPGGAVEGTNGFGEAAYGGPCPPPGDPAHRYQIAVYAVDGGDVSMLDDSAGIGDVLDAIRCCVVATGSLTGLYGRR